MGLKKLLGETLAVSGLLLLLNSPLRAQEISLEKAGLFADNLIDIPPVNPDRLIKARFSPLTMLDKKNGIMEYYPLVIAFSYFNGNGREEKRYFYNFEQEEDGSIDLDLVAFSIDFNENGNFNDEGEQFKAVNRKPGLQVSLNY